MLVELGDGGFQDKLAKPLHQGGGAGEERGPAVLGETEADRGGEVRFAATGRSEDEQVVTLREPAFACYDRHDLGLRE